MREVVQWMLVAGSVVSLTSTTTFAAGRGPAPSHSGPSAPVHSAPSRPSYTPPAPSRPSYTPPAPSRPSYTPPAPSRPSYTPPAPSRPSYTPPAPSRPSYTPPAPSRPSYTPPAPSRPSYTPPAPSRPSYTPPAPSRPSYTPPAPSRPSYTPPAPSRPSYTPPAPSRPSYTPPAPSRPSYTPPAPSRPSYTPPAPTHVPTPSHVPTPVPTPSVPRPSVPSHAPGPTYVPTPSVPRPGVPTHVPAPTHVPTPSIPHTGVPTPRPSTTAPVTPHVPRPAVHGQGDGHAAVHAPRPSTPVPAVKPGHSIGVVSPTHAITAAHAQPQRVAHPSQPSHRLSGQTQVNFRQASESLTRFHGARPDLYARGARVGHRYQTTYNVQLKTRFTIVNKYYTRNEFRFYYGSYFHHGFYGGYYYPVRPCVDFEASFAYPVVDWFYDDGGAVVGDSGEALPDYTDYNDGYYSSTYQQPQPVEVFPYAGDYYPTDALVDMAKDVNGMIYYRQTAFRTAVTQVTNRLKAYIAAQLSGSFEFSDNDIFITHYEDLQTQAIVAEGFVDRENLHVSFKALLDLDDASKSMLFVPSGEQPTDEELATLDAINQRVTALGGDPYTAQQEPTSQTDGQTTPVPSDDEN